MNIVGDLEWARNVMMTVELPRQFSEMQLYDDTWVPCPVLVRAGENAYFRRWFDAWIASDERRY